MALAHTTILRLVPPCRTAAGLALGLIPAAHPSLALAPIPVERPSLATAPALAPIPAAHPSLAAGLALAPIPVARPNQVAAAREVRWGLQNKPPVTAAGVVAAAGDPNKIQLQRRRNPGRGG